MGLSRQRLGCARRDSRREKGHPKIAGYRQALAVFLLGACLSPAQSLAGNLAELAAPGVSLPDKKSESAQKTTAGKDDMLAMKSGKGDFLTLDAGRAPAGPPADPALADPSSTPYYLEVFLNNQPTRMIGEFTRLPDGSFAAKAKELRELGIRPPKTARPDDLVSLGNLGLTWRYDEAAQQIHITLGEEQRIRKVYDMRGGLKAPEISAPDIGGVLNYSLLAAARADKTFASTTFEGLSGNLDGWIYSPWGVLSSSGFVKVEDFHAARFTRLETSWRYTDVKRAITYQLGDVISSGPNWARPVRMGGVRISRNFRVRPDLVTTPLPNLSGTAAVPTTVDVYLNNIRVHTQEVEPGPFTISNIPAISSNGVARLVMRDASGREIISEKSFYSSPKLLREGFMEFSVEAGFPRRNFGQKSNDYSSSPGGTASIRYGLTDRLTLQGHAEVANNLLLGGGGATGVLHDNVLLSAAGAWSHSKKGEGFLVYGALETRWGNFSLNASSQRIFGDYADLATVSSQNMSSATLASSVYTANDFPRAMDQVGIGLALPDLGGGLSVNYLHAESRSQGATNILSVTYNHRLFRNITFYATAFADLKSISKPNFFAGLSIPLGGGRGTASSGISYDESGKYRATASYSKPLQQKDGSVGWRARATYGDLKSAQASLAWRSSKATVRGTAMRIEDNTLGHVMVDGALVIAGGGVFASNRINDSFAVVDAGAPDVIVRYENRPIGKTGSDGKLLIPSLRSFERNKISIDASNLPVDAAIPKTKEIIVPADHSGVKVDFGIKTESKAALVVFTDATGKFIPVGSEVRIEGNEEEFVIGYDGQAYLENLKMNNTIVINTGEEACKARFAFKPKPGEQVMIGPVKCIPAETGGTKTAANEG